MINKNIFSEKRAQIGLLFMPHGPAYYRNRKENIDSIKYTEVFEKNTVNIKTQ